MSSDLGQKQRNPNSLANLAPPWKAGESGNPGGNYKRTPKVSNVYARLLQMNRKERDGFQARIESGDANGAEEIAWQQYQNALKGTPKDQLGAAKEITDRTEGRAPQRIVVDNTSELERLIIRVQERVLAQTQLEISRERAIELITTYRPELAEAIE